MHLARVRRWTANVHARTREHNTEREDRKQFSISIVHHKLPER